MKDLLILRLHLLITIAKLLGPGGAKAVLACSRLMKQQLLVINRTRRRVPNLSTFDRFLLGLWSLFLAPHCILRVAATIRPSMLLNVYRLLKQRKYRLLYSTGHKTGSGPKGPSRELIQEIRTIPYLPLSHPFIERLIGTMRRELIEHVLFWNANDLERKLEDFRLYYNTRRVHLSLDRNSPSESTGASHPSTC